MSDFSIHGDVVLIKNEGIEKAVDLGNQKAVLELAINIVAQAKEYAPVEHGRLRNAIMWAVKGRTGGLNDSGDQQHDRQVDVDPGENGAVVGANLDYAVYQEFGTRNMRPQPYLRPAIAQVAQGQAFETVKAKMEEEMARGSLSKTKERVDFF